jgi:adenylate cyclase
MIDTTSHVLVSLIALGMALAFVSADRQSKTSRALAGGFAGVGLSIYLNVVVVSEYQIGPALAGWFALPETAAMVCILQWILRVRQTLPAAAHLDTRPGDRVLRVGQAAAVFYGLASVLWPELRAEQFIRAGEQPRLFLKPGFWLFFAPVLLAMLSGLMSTLLLLNRRPDRAEAIRVIAMAASTPFLVAGFVLPLNAAALSAGIGEIVFFVGAVHYHVLQGQRGQFMSRFLSPQVAHLVAEQGLERAMQESQREITVVCCDLRGFTAYAAQRPSTDVLQVLRAYYDATGRVVAEYGATIKDFAGDGVLILVGAPLPVPYHAQRGLEMAARIRDDVHALTLRLRMPGEPALGIGLGVATGRVTVGVIGSTSRLEYTAVGSAVNLACRLCEQAQNGQVLVDARTQELASGVLLQPLMPLVLKGFAQPVACAALPG